MLTARATRAAVEIRTLQLALTPCFPRARAMAGLHTHYLIQPSDQSPGLGFPYFYVTDKETRANKVYVALPRILVRAHIQGHITEGHQPAAWGRESQAVLSRARHLLSFSSMHDLSPSLPVT